MALKGTDALRPASWARLDIGIRGPGRSARSRCRARLECYRRGVLRAFRFVLPCAACASCSLVYDLGALSHDVEVAQPALAPRNDASSDTGGEAAVVPPPNSGPCRPATDASAAMVWAGTFCIDSTEVSNAHYLAFLEADAGASPGEDATLLPEGAWPPDSSELNLPVVGVNWHAAHAYCTFAGKRLCGGGADVRGADGATPSGEWYAACSKNGSRVYPYGDELIPGECATQGTLRYLFGTACEGGYRGLRDMVGNTAEWTSTCDGEICSLQGGSALDQRADCSSNMPLKRTQRWPLAGIRCCADSSS